MSMLKVMGYEGKQLWALQDEIDTDKLFYMHWVAETCLTATVEQQLMIASSSEHFMLWRKLAGMHLVHTH